MDSNKVTDAIYVPAAKALFASMKIDGFQPYWPILVGRDGEILDGAHRVACALALDIPIIVQPTARVAWAPSWGRSWFVENGMCEADLNRLAADYTRLIEWPYVIQD